MLFSSLSFLSYFLPIFLICYFIFYKYKNIVLLIFSLVFYSYGEPIYIILLIFSSTVDFFVSKKLEKTDNKSKRKQLLLISILVNVLLLTFFKYSDFLIITINSIFKTNISLLYLALPIGISFYTFQTISYTIDCYRKEIKPQKNYFTYLTYVSMFPQLIAGPIIRYQDIEDDLENRIVTQTDIEIGSKRFIQGLAKKILIGDRMSEMYLALSSSSSTLGIWMAMLAYAMHIYYDFSGYSDMAIGLGRIIGFKFKENFDHPYISRSVSEFFRRWHMSLGHWFRDYIYIPMGGSRVTKKKLILNLFAVWAITGLWHGANFNFVAWGLYYFVLIVIEKFFLRNFLKKHKVFSHAYLIVVVILSYVLFSNTNIDSIKTMYTTMFSFTKLDANTLFNIKNSMFFTIVSILFCLPKFTNILAKLPTPIKNILYIIILVLSFMYISSNSISPFIYFRF